MATTVTLKPNAIDLSGSTSGTTTLQATAVAGTTTITLPAATDTLVGKATTDTLTNTTLTAPVISTISNTGTLTLPTSTDTLVGRATTDTLTNKTLTTPVISSLSSASATALTLQSAGTTAITVSTAQNVGIGTTAPNKPLSVYGGDGYIQMLNASTGTGNTDGAFIGVEGGTTGLRIVNQENDVMSFHTNGLANERMRIDASGRVGIGTSSPGEKLDVSGAIRSNVSGGTPAIYFGDGTYQTSITGQSNSIRFIGDAGAERGRFDSSGSFLVGFTSGTATPAQGVGIGGQASAGVYIGHANGTSSGNYYMAFSYNGSAIGSITQNGTTNVAYNTSSDYRLKENIQPMQNALATVAQLKPVTYKWKTDGSDGQGFIAHELQAVVPDCVTGDKDGLDDDGNPKYQGVDTSFLVATLTAALQETKALIDTQAETINALTARIVALESK